MLNLSSRFIIVPRACRLQLRLVAIVVALLVGLQPAAACTGDINNDNDVDIDDLLAVIGGWGPCPMPCPPACAPDIDQDCSVNINDLLGVIGAWGPCPCVSSGIEPNDTCASPTTLATVGSNQLLTLSNANLPNNTDVDIFRIRAMETDSTCSCCDGGFCLDEDFQLIIRLTTPVNSAVAYQFCTGATCATVTTQCINVMPGTTGQLVWTFDGDCTGAANQYEVFVRIRAAAAGQTSCVPYTLTYQFIPGCF